LLGWRAATIIVWIRGSHGCRIFRKIQRCSSILLGDGLESFNYCHATSGSKVMANTLFRQGQVA
jgi:hypothetical protein